MTKIKKYSGICTYTDHTPKQNWVLFKDTGDPRLAPIFFIDILEFPSPEEIQDFMWRKWKKEKTIEKIVKEIGKLKNPRITFYKIEQTMKPEEVCSFISKNSQGGYACKIWLSIIDIFLKELCKNGTRGKFNTGNPIVVLTRPITEECLEENRKLPRLRRYHDLQKSRWYMSLKDIGSAGNIIVCLKDIPT